MLGVLGWQAARVINKLDGHGDRLTTIETIMGTNKPLIEAIPDIKTEIVALRTSIDDSAKINLDHRQARDLQFSGLQTWISKISDQVKNLFAITDLFDKRLSIDEIKHSTQGHSY